MLDQSILARYARAVVSSCLRVRDSDPVAIHAEPAHLPLVEALTEAAYAVGARFVDVMLVDPRVRRARLRFASEDGLGYQPAWHDQRMRRLIVDRAALISINAPAEPDVMADTDPARGARERSSRIPGVGVYLRAVQRAQLRFCVITWPLDGWSTTAYPDLSPAEATRLVAIDLAHFCRIGPGDGDGTAAWDRHLATLVRRAETLSDLQLDRIELRGPGTDLSVGLVDGGRFLAAEETTAFGDRYCANLPTEEVFTSPDPRRTEGTFRCTRPLTLEGRRMTGIHGRFRRGRIVEVGADRASDQAFLTGYLERDRGAARLGELALVDSTSRIGQSGRTYGITLLDENAVCHIAFGAGFAVARTPGRGTAVNGSSIHTDVMIGAPEIEVTGHRRDGSAVPLIIDGVWASALR